jgi:hypothetical protein
MFATMHKKVAEGGHQISGNLALLLSHRYICMEKLFPWDNMNPFLRTPFYYFFIVRAELIYTEETSEKFELDR